MFYEKVLLFYTEEDDTETYTYSQSVTSELATNFGLNAGITEKIGLSFGSSSKENITSTYTLQKTVGSDELGTVEINFQDPVLVDGIDPFIFPITGKKLYEVGNPYVKMAIIPKKIY
ncbi:MAG TPA: hypothetical protein DDZ96_02855 [Porphyromonadaceae bacterium]|nr:hypothetical protein [Porphyromonadaceae bacterium]HBX19790.1 hypothetical protein [Porphyromonadaceae bacterium]HCM19427.1 hypothetical protein [Porphyromonadaceae bacterium]